MRKKFLTKFPPYFCYMLFLALFSPSAVHRYADESEKSTSASFFPSPLFFVLFFFDLEKLSKKRSEELRRADDDDFHKKYLPFLQNVKHPGTRDQNRLDHDENAGR